MVTLLTIVTSSYVLKLSHLSHFHQNWSHLSKYQNIHHGHLSYIFVTIVICVTLGISHILGIVTLITFSPKLVTFVEIVTLVTMVTLTICFNCKICHSGNIYKNDYVCHNGHIFKEELNYEFLGKKIHWEEQILKRGLKGGWWWLPIKGFAVLPTPA